MNDKITLKNFGASNRTRRIGNSVYRICKTITGKWYIYENYDDGYEINRGYGYYCQDLATVIDCINSFTKEKEIVNNEDDICRMEL